MAKRGQDAPKTVNADTVAQAIAKSKQPHGRPATALAREAIETWVEERQRQAVHDPIVEYAATMAGSAADLDEALGWASKVTRLISSPIEVWPFVDTAGG